MTKKITKTVKVEYAANLTREGDTMIETVDVLVRNGSYRIHRAEFPVSYLGDADVEVYTANMLRSVVRMAANQIRTDGLR